MPGKRRYALDLLQILARSPTGALSPGILTRELSKQHASGIHLNNVSRLIARLKEAHPIEAHEGATGDARTRPVRLTVSGMDVLERLRPDWLISRPFWTERALPPVRFEKS